jgi:hypothetical protein
MTWLFNFISVKSQKASLSSGTTEKNLKTLLQEYIFSDILNVHKNCQMSLRSKNNKLDCLKKIFRSAVSLIPLIHFQIQHLDKLVVDTKTLQIMKL